LPTFSKDCALVTIDGSHNNISKLDKLKGLKYLNIVNMDYNKNISSVKVLADCPVLVQVNVYGTKVKDVSALTSQSIIVNYKPV
jgi:Leucine-rich repeat (LRR) protein